MVLKLLYYGSGWFWCLGSGVVVGDMVVVEGFNMKVRRYWGG